MALSHAGTWYADPAHFRAPSRRDFLYAGWLGGLGLTVGHLFRLQARAAESTGNRIETRARSVIHIYLQGGFAHMDSFDPKPDAPLEYRGILGTVDTALAGVQFSSHMQETAKIADKLTVVRSMSHTEVDHSRGQHSMFTGYRPSPALIYPSVGSVVAHELGPRDAMPPYLCVPAQGSEYLGSGYLSNSCGPFALGSDPARPNFTVRDLNRPKGVNPDRFESRKSWKELVDDHFHEMEHDDALTTMDSFYQRAYDLLASPTAREAFSLKGEDASTLDLYGMKSWGPVIRPSAGAKFLIARRLVEAGARFVTVTYGAWDTHSYHYRSIEPQMPDFDKAFAGLAWRGPRGDGISRETAAPLRWSASENIAWKMAVPGTGRSSPIVVGSRVVVTTGEETDQSRRVLCIDRDSGALLWNTAVHRGAGGMMHRLNSTASSTPAADAQRVYAVFVDDEGMRVVAVDMSGQVVWSVSPGGFQSQHGFAASPVLFGTGVIVNGQQDGEAFVVMLERATGDELWRYRPKVNLRSFSTPVLIRHDGVDQLLLVGASQTVALDPRTGKAIWFADGPSEKFVSTPAVGHGLVFSFGGSPEKRAMAIRLGGRGDVLNTHVVWRNERSMPYVPSPLLAGDFLHVISDTGIYTCLDPLTGDAKCTGRKLGPVNSSPVFAAGRVYFFEDSGTCTVIENSAAFEVIARNEIGEAVYTTPAISAGSLLVRTESHILRIGK